MPSISESWWRNPIVVVGTVIVLLTGGGAVTWWRLGATQADTSVAPIARAVVPPQTAATTQAPAPAPASTPAPTTTAAAPPSAEPDPRPATESIGAVLARAEPGRAALRRRDYAAALRNRRTVVAAVRGMDVSAAPSVLRRAERLLRAATEASAAADQQHIDCGCDGLQPADRTAHGLKRRCAEVFDPYARRFLGHSVDPNRI